MTDEAQSYTRAELYELLGTIPATQLEQRFNMTSAAIAKRCRKLKIPVFGRGDWEKLRVGKPIIRAPLPVDDQLSADTVAISAWDISRLAGLKGRRAARQASHAVAAKRKRPTGPKRGEKARGAKKPSLRDELAEELRPPPPHEERASIKYVFDVSDWSWEYENARTGLSRPTADDPDSRLDEFSDIVVRGKLHHPPEFVAKVMVLTLTAGPSTHDFEFVNTDRAHVGAVEIAYGEVCGRARVSVAAASLLVRALDGGRTVHVNVTAEPDDTGSDEIMTRLRFKTVARKIQA